MNSHAGLVDRLLSPGPCRPDRGDRNGRRDVAQAVPQAGVRASLHSLRARRRACWSSARRPSTLAPRGARAVRCHRDVMGDRRPLRSSGPFDRQGNGSAAPVVVSGSSTGILRNARARSRRRCGDLGTACWWPVETSSVDGVPTGWSRCVPGARVSHQYSGGRRGEHRSWLVVHGERRCRALAHLAQRSDLPKRGPQRRSPRRPASD